MAGRPPGAEAGGQWLDRRPASDLGGGGPGTGVEHLGGNPEDAGHAQRPRRTAGDGETLGGYPLTAQRPSMILGGAARDLGGCQQVQAVIVGAARPPQQLPDTRFPGRRAGVVVAKRGSGTRKPARRKT
ncbi:MAG: hypothetical protein JO309_00145 [Pseudonocardiales bacterium]|nr:hypothetical protein [Pseudonocardiales bacterium]MBV9727833.1 hypothetical protein [Pseudonocardiales bacterium]